MKDLPLGTIAALVPEFVVKDLPLGRTLMMMMMLLNQQISHQDAFIISRLEMFVREHRFRFSITFT